MVLQLTKLDERTCEACVTVLHQTSAKDCDAAIPRSRQWHAAFCRLTMMSMVVLHAKYKSRAQKEELTQS